VGEKQGKVREAKQRLEDKIRKKKKRDTMMAEIRKPLVSSPTRKRDRRENGRLRY
jgi:hypothetical protein